MNRKNVSFWVVFWAIGIFIGSVAGFLLYQGVITGRQWSYESKLKKKMSARPTAAKKQAAGTVYYQTPFYHSFRLRATHMHSLEAFSEELEFEARHNSQGFRTPEFTTAHPPNTFRILIIGDSTTWGQGVRENELYSYVLETLLNRHCSRFRTEVIALGVQGHRLVDDVIKLLVLGKSLSPDLFIFQAGTNDLDFYDYSGAFVLNEVENLEAVIRAQQEETFSPGSLDWKMFEESKEVIKKWSEVHTVPVGFVVFPIVDTSKRGRNFGRYNIDKFGALPEFVGFLNVVNALKKDFPTLYLIDAFREQAGDRYLAVSENDGHTNALGHRLAAENLFRFLQQTGLFDCSSAKIQPEGTLWKKESVLRKEATQNWQDYNASYASQLKFFIQLKQLYPNDAWITHQLANVYFQSRMWKDSYHTYATLTRMLPENAAPWYHMALNSGEIGEKIRLLNKMLQVLPDHTQSMSELALLYSKQNKIAEACRLLARLLEIPGYKAQYDASKELYEKNNCGVLMASSQ